MFPDRALPRDDEAVSPVLSTLLMIALTVVLVGAIFWVIAGFGGEEPSTASAVSWSVDDETDRILVLSAQGHTDWSRLAIQVTVCNQATDNLVGHVGATEGISNGKYYNEPAAADGGALNAATTGQSCGEGTPVPLSETPAPIWSDDYLAFCAEGGEMTAVTVQIHDTVANTRIRSATFDSWAPC